MRATYVGSQQGIRHPIQAWANLTACLPAHHCSHRVLHSACSSVASTWGGRQALLKVQGKNWFRKQGLELQLDHL